MPVEVEIAEVAPVQIAHRNWVCIGFEERGVHRGDNLHLAFVCLGKAWPSACDSSLLDCARSELATTVRSPILRVHSECLLGDALGSTMCDCGNQLSFSISTIAAEGKGILVYLRQEGRGIGLRKKLSALALQEGFRNGAKSGPKLTPDAANLAMGHDVDERNYEAAVAMIRALGVTSVTLVSGNPDKIHSFLAAGVNISSLIHAPAAGYSERQLIELREKAARNFIVPIGSRRG